MLILHACSSQNLLFFLKVLLLLILKVISTQMVQPKLVNKVPLVSFESSFLHEFVKSKVLDQAYKVDLVAHSFFVLLVKQVLLYLFLGTRLSLKEAATLHQDHSLYVLEKRVLVMGSGLQFSDDFLLYDFLVN
jgi:hypothetical protein